MLAVSTAMGAHPASAQNALAQVAVEESPVPGSLTELHDPPAEDLEPPVDPQTDDPNYFGDLDQDFSEGQAGAGSGEGFVGITAKKPAWKASCVAAKCNGKELRKTTCGSDPKRKILDNVDPRYSPSSPSSMILDAYLVHSPGCKAFWVNIEIHSPSGTNGGTPASCNGLAGPQAGRLLVEVEADRWRPYGSYTTVRGTGCPAGSLYRLDTKLLRSGSGYRATVCRTYRLERCSSLSFTKP